MSSDATSLHMLSLRLDAARLMDLGRRRRLPMRDVDPGYLVHSQLGELFGEMAPNVFAIASDQGRSWRVLAYGDHDGESLRSQAEAFADPAIHAVVEWESFATKRMPTEWPEGKVLGFEVRVCPVVRKSGDGERHRKGAEVDAFLSKCWAVGPEVTVDRETVYREWLAERLARQGGVTLRSSQVLAFQRQRLVRRTQGEDRKAHLAERPDVTIRGDLLVSNPADFAKLLRRGVGRHRAFGFGMMLLRPASSPC